MNLLKDKTILITGIASDRSIAYHIAELCAQHQARLIVTYPNDRMKSRVKSLVESWPNTQLIPCDVTNDDHIQNIHDQLMDQEIQLNGLVHAIAFSDRSQIQGRLIDDLDRQAFLDAINISAYSLPVLCSALQPCMSLGASVATLSFIGSQLAIPNYNVMGIAKAALESSVRYLARDLGPDNIRVNALSAGPIRTLAASGIKGFRDMLVRDAEITPLPGNTRPEEVANHCLYLLSDLSHGMTGQIMYVDHGYHITAAT